MKADMPGGVRYNGKQGVWGVSGTPGRRFRENIIYTLQRLHTPQYCFAAELCDLGWAPCVDSADRKLRRYISGQTKVTLEVLELFSAALGIPPAVLAYGSLREVDKALGFAGRRGDYRVGYYGPR